MRIAVVHNLRAGGAARRLVGMVGPLADTEGVEIKEFTLSTGRGTLAKMGGGTLPIPQYSVNHEPLAPRSPRLLRPLLRYVDVVRLARRWRTLAVAIERWEPDVVFSNPCGLILGAPPIHRELRERPILYYCDEPRRSDYEPAARSSTNPATRHVYGLMRCYEKHLDRSSIAAADAVVTNSEHSRDGIEHAYGCSAAVVSPGTDAAFVKGHADASPTHCLSVGSLIPSKGHDLAIRAVGSAGVPLPLAIVAPRSDVAERARLTALADRHEVALEFHFGISDDELAALYRNALATLYLARAEPLGLVSLESQACGTPCIVADEGGLRNTVRDNSTGFIVRRDDRAPGEALAKLLDPDLAERIRQDVRRVEVRRNAETAREILSLLTKIQEAG